MEKTRNEQPIRQRLQRRVMWRVSGIIVIAFIVVAALTIGVLINIRTDEARRYNESSVLALMDIIQRELAVPINEVTRLATMSSTRIFARLATNDNLIGFRLPEIDQLRPQLISAFNDTLTRGGDSYLFLRYVARDGLVWAEKINENAGVSSRDELRLVVASGLSEVLQQGLGGQVFFSEYIPQIENTNSGGFYLYVPVAPAGNLLNILGVIQLGITTDTLDALLNDVLNSALLNQDGRRLILVDSRNQVIVDTGGAGGLGQIVEFLNATPGIVQAESLEGNLLLSATSIETFDGMNTPWRVVIVDDLNVAMQETYQLAVLIAAGYALVCLVVLFIVHSSVSSLLMPLNRLVFSARRLIEAQDTQDAVYRDEIDSLDAAVKGMEKRIEVLSTDLETQIKRRTRDLELAARIGQEVAKLYDIDTLLNRAINLIADELGFYHAQVFLVDDAGLNAVLVHSRGKAGEELLKRNFKIPVGSDTVIGTVTQKGTPVIVNDTLARNIKHGFNPLLPETRAEIGLPLISGDKIIGALDIQSKQPNVFFEDDLPTYALLSSQLAIAIENARLVSQTGKRMQQIDMLNRQLTRAAWQTTRSQDKLNTVYRYNLLNVERDATPQERAALRSEISIRGEVIGELMADPGDGQAFSEGDAVILEAVANRVALAIENARLFQETQSTLNETSVLYQLTRHLNEASTLEDIVQAIITVVMPEAISGQVWLFDDYDLEESPEWITLQTDLAFSERDENNQNLTGLRLRMHDHNFLRAIRSDQIVLVENVRTDNRIDNGLKLIFRRLAAESLVIIPMNVRGSWRGLMMMGFKEPRQFDEREARIYGALSDQAGVAIDNRLLLQQTERQVTRNENLYAASRIINTAQNFQDLVYAAVATSPDPTLNYALSLLEGGLDATGWSTQARMVARSQAGIVHQVDIPYTLHIQPESPLRQREPEVIIDDMPSNVNPTPPIQWLRQLGYRFMAVFPLFSSNQPIALFHIVSEQIYELSPDDYEVYRAITGQMSSQIQIRKLLERTEAALDETRRLYVASRAITGANDFQEIYQAAADHLARPFLPMIQQQQDVIKIAVLLAQPTPTIDASYLEYAYVWCSDPTTFTHEVGETIASQDAPYGRLTQAADSALVFPDITQANGGNAILADEPRLRARLLDEEVVSMVLVPMRSRAQWFGALVIQSQRPNTFDEQYARFAMALGDQMAIAIQNLRLIDEARFEASRAQSEAQRALALAEAAQLSNRLGGDDIAQGLDEVFERVAEVSGLTRWMLFRFREGTPVKLELIIANMPNISSGDKVVYDLDVHIPLVDAVRLHQSILVNDILQYPGTGFDDPQYAEYNRHFWGKHIATPVAIGGQILGSIVMGRAFDTPDLDERDQELVETLATQVAIALENRRLFRQAQNEQQTLRSILETLPAGLIVLDPDTLTPTQYNEQAQQLLGREIDPREPFNIATYRLYRTGTQLYYPEDEMPIYLALNQGTEASTDDVAVIFDDGSQVDLLVNAAPIIDVDGRITGIVVAFTDITSLRALENTLQENLRETVSLYEAQRQLSEAATLDEVLDVLNTNVILQQPSDAYILLTYDNGRLYTARYFIEPLDDPEKLRAVLDEQESFMIDDVNNDLRIDHETRLFLMSLNVASLMTIPLRVSSRERAIGWLVLFSDTPSGITSEQERVLGQLRDLASTVIDNRLLIEAQQSALREVRLLYNATNNISRAREIDQLTTVLFEAVDLLNPDYAFAYLDEAAGLKQGNYQLFNMRAPELEPVDFRAIMAGYDIPPGGVYIDDIERITERVETEQKLYEAGIRAFAAINLRPRDVNDGMILIAYCQPHRFTDTEDRYLNTLADSSSVVFNSIILFDQIQGALEETSTLYQASRALSDVSEPKQLLSVIVDYLIAPHINQVFIALLESRSWDTPNATAQIVGSWHEEEIIDLTGVTLTQEHFPAWHLLSSPTVLTIDDIYQDENLDEMTLIGLESLDVRSLVIVPLRVPKREIGAIWISSKETHYHLDRELRTYQSFSEQASLSMEASYLLAQTERRARQLQTSAEVSQSVSSILDLEELFPRLVNLIKDAFGYDHVQIFLMDDMDDWAELRASTGEAGRQLLAIRHRLRKGSDSVIGMVTAKGEPQIALDTADANVVHQPNPFLPLTRSEMALPLIIKGRVVGALDVQSNQPNAFNEEDVKVLTTLAAQISVAIDNARLYEAAQQQAGRMSFLFEVTSEAAAAATLDETLQVVANRVQEMLDAQAVIVYLPQLYMDDRENVIKTLRPVALAGLNQPLDELEEIRMDDPAYLLSHVSSTMQAFVIEDIKKESRYLPVSSNARSAVIIPLVAGGELTGVAVLENSRIKAYGYDTLQLLLTMAGSLAAVIQSARLLEQLQQTNEQLRELDRLKSDFLANMSHELRTPLNSIIGFSRVMLKGIDGPLTEMQEQDLTTIYNSGQHLLMLINDVLDQAKIAADKMDLKFAYFEVKPLVEGVKSIGIGLVKDKPIDMRVELAPNLPKVYGDEFRTRQILLNLVSNAAKFTQEGSITVRAYQVDVENRRYVKIEVEDTGIGIAQKDIPLLFEAFRQVDSSLTRTQGGTGLGLPIAKSLTELQGGQMTVTSEVNVGSIFSITIPVEPVMDENGEPVDQDKGAEFDEFDATTNITNPVGVTKPTRTPPSEPKPTLSTNTARRVVQTKRQILLIEDDKNMVDQFRRSLQREGFEVVVGDHPAYAEAMASQMRPNVIVMDVNFANGEGWNILQRLKDRDDTFDIPIVVVTLSDDSQRAYQLGAHSFIQRPFMPEALTDAVLKAEKESNIERILIIDDQPNDIRLLTQLLNNSGTYRVFSAATGIEGISMVARRRPDLIILDLRMPEMDGFAVLDQLRSNPETANIPVLVVTGELTLNETEQQQLNNIRVLHKTNISEEAYNQFIEDVRRHLDMDK